MRSLYQKFSHWTALLAGVCLACGLTGCAGKPAGFSGPGPQVPSPAFSSVDSRKPVAPGKETARPSFQQDLQFAERQFNRGEYAVAEFFFRKALLKDPEHERILRFLPRSYFFQKDIGQALTAFQRSHAFSPKDPDPLLGMGWCYLIMKRYPEALDAFGRAESLTGPSHESRKGMALVAWRQKRRNLAQTRLAEIYPPAQVASILDYLEALGDRAFFDLSPGDWGEPSLFALSAEHPRFKSALWRLDQPREAALDPAWDLLQRQIHKNALEAFEALPQKLADTLDAKNGLAWSYLENRRIRDAEALFREILREYPSFPGAVLGVRRAEAIKMEKAAFGQYYLGLGKVRIAENNFLDLADEFPEWAHPRMQLGNVALRKGDYDVAEAYFHEALVREPGHAGALEGLEQVRKFTDPELYRADQALKSGDYKQAARIYYDYIESRDPSLPAGASVAHAYNGLGWSQFEKGHYRLAAEKFQQARAHPAYAKEAFKGLGYAFYMMGQFDKSSDYLLTAKPQPGASGDILYKLDWSILKGKDTKQAQRYFEEELHRDPLRPSLYMGMGWVQYSRRNPDLAVEYFLKAISLDPDIARSGEFTDFLRKQRFGWQVYNRLGWAYYHEREHEQSLEMFELSLREQPEKSEAHHGIGYNLFRLGKYNTAAAYLRKSLTLNPEPNSVTETVREGDGLGTARVRTTVRTKLARAYHELGMYPEAAGLFQEALRRQPGSVDAHDGLGWTYLKMNRLAEARAAFTQALRLHPLNPFADKGLTQVKQMVATKNLRERKNLSVPQIVKKTRQEMDGPN